MTVHIISTPQLSDQGSEGSAGYDYQKEFALMLCIDMLLDKNSRCVICEFHEDVVQISRGWEIDLIQVKKKENGNWSLNDLIKPDKKQTQGIMAKLLSPMQQGKAIRKIRLAGYGKVTPSKGDGNLNLAELVTLLKTPQVLRKNEWLSKIQEYQVYLAQELQVQSIRADVIEDALQVLEIDFSSPHPEAIALDCHRKLTRVIKQIWDVSITHDEVTEIYHDLYSRIKGISNKPRQPWNEKAITRQEVTEIVGQRLRNLSPAANRKATMNTQDKLTSVGLGSKSTYAFQKRLDAIGLRYELGLSSSQWEDFKTEISCACEEMRMQTPGIKGATLWKGLRKIFHELGNSWSVKDDKRLNSEFVEGVFFDMTGVCEARLDEGANLIDAHFSIEDRIVLDDIPNDLVISTRLPEHSLNPDESLEYHASRILLMLKYIGIKGRITGRTKIAKLDFFVRYPSYLAKAQGTESQPLSKLPPESPMIRYKYGPWDTKYYDVFATLVARGLLNIYPSEKGDVFELTERGEYAVQELELPEFDDIIQRCIVVAKLFKNKPGSALKKYIYDNYPEIVALQVGEEIEVHE